MPLKSICLAAALFFGCVCGVGAGIITSTATGMIGEDTNIDDLGLFGVAGADLAGLAYTQTISFDRALNTDYDDPDVNQSRLSAGSAPVTISVTVNNRTFTAVFTGNSQYLLSNGVSVPFPLHPVDEMYTYADGSDASGNVFVIAQDLWSDTEAFVGPSLDLSAYHFRIAAPGDITGQTFGISDEFGISTTFSGSVASIEFSETGTDPDPSSVPEPAPLSLLGIGVLVFAASRRFAAK